MRGGGGLRLFGGIALVGLIGAAVGGCDNKSGGGSGSRVAKPQRFTGTISGKVIVLATGEPVVGALATTTVNGREVASVTDTEGKYTFTNVPYTFEGSEYGIVIDLRDESSETSRDPRTVSPDGLTDFAYTSASLRAQVLGQDTSGNNAPGTPGQNDGDSKRRRLDESESGQGGGSTGTSVIGVDRLHVEADLAAVRRVGASIRGTVEVSDLDIGVQGVVVSLRETPFGCDDVEGPTPFTATTTTTPGSRTPGRGSVNGLEHSTSVSSATTDASGNFTLANVPELDCYDLIIDGSAAGLTTRTVTVGQIGTIGTTFAVSDATLTLRPSGTDRTPPQIVLSGSIDSGATLPSVFSTAGNNNLTVRFTFNEAIDPFDNAKGRRPEIEVYLDADQNGIATQNERDYRTITARDPGSLTVWRVMFDEIPPAGAGQQAGVPPLVFVFKSFRDLTGNPFTGGGFTVSQRNLDPEGIAITVLTAFSAPTVTATFGTAGVPAGNAAPSSVMNDALIAFDDLRGPLTLVFNRPMEVAGGGGWPFFSTGDISIAVDTDQDGFLDGDTDDVLIDRFVPPARMFGGSTSATTFDFDFLELPAGMGINQISGTNPPAFNPPKLVVRFRGFRDENGNPFQGAGLGSGVVLDPRSSGGILSPTVDTDVHIVLRTAADQTLLAVAANTIVVGEDPGQRSFLALSVGKAARVPQINQSSRLDQKSELERLAPFYTTAANGFTPNGPPIPSGTTFGPLGDQGGEVDRVRIRFDDPSIASVSNAVLFKLALSTNGTTFTEIADSADPLADGVIENTAPVGGTRTFLIDINRAFMSGKLTAPFNGNGTTPVVLKAKIITRNQFGRDMDSPVFDIADLTPPAVSTQDRVSSKGRPLVTVGAVPHPATDGDFGFDLFTGDLDIDAQTPALVPTFLPIVEMRNDDIEDQASNLLDKPTSTNPADRLDGLNPVGSNNFGERRPGGVDGSYSAQDIADPTNGALFKVANPLTGDTIFRTDYEGSGIPVEFNERLTENVDTYFGFLGDISYSAAGARTGANPVAVFADRTGPQQVGLHVSNMLTVRMRDFLQLPNVTDANGLKAGAGDKCVTRDAIGPVPINARLSTGANGVGVLTVTFNKNVDPRTTDPSFSLQNPGGAIMNLGSPQVMIVTTGNVVTITELIAGVPGIRQATADWVVNTGLATEPLGRGINPLSVDLEVGINQTLANFANSGVNTPTGDAIAPIITAVADGGEFVAGSGAGSLVTVDITVSEDCMRHLAGATRETETAYDARIAAGISLVPASGQTSFVMGQATVTNDRAGEQTTDAPNETLVITVVFTTSRVLVAGDRITVTLDDASGNPMNAARDEVVAGATGAPTIQ